MATRKSERKMKFINQRSFSAVHLIVAQSSELYEVWIRDVSWRLSGDTAALRSHKCHSNHPSINISRSRRAQRIHVKMLGRWEKFRQPAVNVRAACRVILACSTVRRPKLTAATNDAYVGHGKRQPKMHMKKYWGVHVSSKFIDLAIHPWRGISKCRNLKTWRTQKCWNRRPRNRARRLPAGAPAPYLNYRSY